MDSGKAILGVAGNKYLLPVIFFYLFPGRFPGASDLDDYSTTNFFVSIFTFEIVLTR